MILITVARKPLEGTVVENSTKYGVGGLNIDQTRISAGTEYTDVAPTIRYRQTSMIMGGHQTRPWIQKAIAENKPVKTSIPSQLGRWPTNLILSHSAGCAQSGTKNIKAAAPRPSGIDAVCTTNAMQGYRPKAYKRGKPPDTPPDRRNPDGTETVQVWECVDGCPVLALSEQSGESQSSNQPRFSNVRSRIGPTGHTANNYETSGYNDSGGASRFFKQVHNDE